MIITKKMLEDKKLLREKMGTLTDSPLYASTDGITRGEAWAIDYILEYGLDNHTQFEIIIKKGKIA